MITKEKGVKILVLCARCATEDYTIRQLTEYYNYELKEEFSPQAIRAFLVSRDMPFKKHEEKGAHYETFNPLIPKNNYLSKKWDKDFRV